MFRKYIFKHKDTKKQSIYRYRKIQRAAKLLLTKPTKFPSARLCGDF